MRKLIIHSLLPLTFFVTVSATAWLSANAAVAPEVLAEAAAGEDHAEGVPLAFKTNLALWSVVVFVIFVLLLKKFAWGPLAEGLDKREALIRKDIDDAETARVKAEQMLGEHAEKLDKVYDEVREILAEARRDAEHTKNEIIAEAQHEAEATKQRAIDEIERSRDQALKELFDHMAGQVANATEHVLGRSLTDADQDRLIDEALAQVSQSD